MDKPHRPSGFTLIEILVTVTIMGILGGLLIPALSHGKRLARAVVCRHHLKQLGVAVTIYTDQYNGYFMPLVYTNEWPVRYWWGTSARPMDYKKGFIYPYLNAELRPESVLECPEQPFGSYMPQGPGRQPTSTYGYNGYYLCPSATPGWQLTIGSRSWRRFEEYPAPDELFLFADTLIDWGRCAGNNCLLDPPLVYSGGSWTDNPAPTTCFRHSGRAAVCYADGHVDAVDPQGGRITSPRFQIGSCGSGNDHYVPDWQDW